MHLDAEPLEECVDEGGNGSAADTHHADAVKPDGGPHLGKHHLLGQGVFFPEEKRQGPVGDDVGHRLARDPLAPPENFLLGIGRLPEVGHDALVYLLQHARHHEERGGPYLLQILKQEFRAAAVGEHASLDNHRVISHRALKRMGDGKQRKRNHIEGERVVLKELLYLLYHVGMREHHSLGISRGARRVDQRHQVVALDGRASIVYLIGFRGSGPLRYHLFHGHEQGIGQVNVIEHNHFFQSGHRGLCLQQPVNLGLARAEANARVGVVDDIGRFLR